MKNSKLILIIFLLGKSLFADTLITKSGKVYTNVVTKIEPNNIIITNENGQIQDISKSEVKRLIIENTTWDSEGNQNKLSDIDSNLSLESKKSDINDVNENHKNSNNSENTSNSKSTENRGSSFFINFSTADWQVGSVQNLIALRYSRAFNSFAFSSTQLYWQNYLILPISENISRVKAKNVDLGYKFFQTTNFPGKLQIRTLWSGPTQINSTNFWYFNDPNSIGEGQSLEFDLYKLNSIRRNIYSYEQKIYFNRLTDTFSFSRFGLQLGGNVQVDSMKGEMTSLGRLEIYDSGLFLGATNSLPLPAKNKYSETSNFINAGLFYHLNFLKNHEIELALNLFKGISKGKIDYNSISVFPFPTGTTKIFQSNLTGLGINFVYNLKISDRWIVKFLLESRKVNYQIQKIKTTNFGIHFGDDLGPISDYSDMVSTFGIGFEIKF